MAHSVLLSWIAYVTKKSTLLNRVDRYEKQELHEMQDELEDLRDCGLGGCRPKFIQGLANIKVKHFVSLPSDATCCSISIYHWSWRTLHSRPSLSGVRFLALVAGNPPAGTFLRISQLCDHDD